MHYQSQTCDERSDSPAVVGGAVVAARESLEHYRALGCADWAEEQAMQDARKSIRCLRTFFLVHGLTFQAEEPELLLAYYRDLWLSGRFVPLAKWATAVPLAQMAGVVDSLTGSRVHNPSPPKPDWLPDGTSPLTALLPTFEVRREKAALRARLGERQASLRPTRRARDLAWSLLGSKGMFPALWVDQVGKSLHDHSQLLGHTLPPPLPSDAEEVLQVVAESISLLTTPHPTSYSSLPRPRLSSSAGWVKLFDEEARRWTTMRGTRAAQFERLGGYQAQELVHMDYRPWAGVVETRGIPYQFNWLDWDFDPKVSVIALQEPFKIRTISIADGPATAAASPIQKVVHTALRALSPFSLVGGERVADSVRDVFPHWDRAPFVSGDYSAATDRLSLRASQVVLRGLLKRVALDPRLRHRIERSLLESHMDYSRTLETFRGRVPDALLDSIVLPPTTRQVNGQLMGNILSFPILCLVNLAGYLLAVLRNGSSWDLTRSGDNLYDLVRRGMERGHFLRRELDDLPVLINGDDILFQAHLGLYEQWLSTIGDLGFKPSVGKNYYSDEFFTVNSELYTREGFRSRPWWGGFETDLVRARQEIRFETGVDVLQADLRRVLPAMQSWLKETVPASRWAQVNRVWLMTFHDAGMLAPYSGLNWFLPLPLGGMGLDPAGFEDFEVTYAQRKLAVRLSLDPDGFRFPGAEGSLISQEADEKYRLLLGSVPRRGVLVEWNGIKYVLDKSVVVPGPSGPDGASEPSDGGSVFTDSGVQGEDEEEDMVWAWPLVSSKVQAARHIDRWLDHHVTGIRLDADRVRDGVRRALKWGLRMSDKHLVAWEELDVSPVYQCARKRELIPRAIVPR